MKTNFEQQRGKLQAFLGRHQPHNRQGQVRLTVQRKGGKLHVAGVCSPCGAKMKATFDRAVVSGLADDGSAVDVFTRRAEPFDLVIHPPVEAA